MKTIAKLHYTDFDWTGECFLLADDDRFSHLLLEKALNKTGVKVYHAYTGKEAIELLKSKDEITIALIDIKMPQCDGFEVIQNAKMFCPGVTFFAYTADTFNIDKVRCKDFGFADCFTKPMLPAILFYEIYSCHLMRHKL